jgi:DnaD/phage-associated family protein
MTTSYSWIKLWHEILDDPKMGRLSDHLYRRCIEIFLMAGRNGQTGELPTENDMCWTLRTEPEQLRAELEELQRASIIHRDGDAWIVTNFQKRQAATPGAQRVSDFRKRQKTNSEKLESQEDVTIRYNCNVQNVTSPVRESTSTTTLNINTNSIFALYEQEIGVITKAVADQLAEAEKEYPAEWFGRAFQEAALHNVRNFAYISAILKRWKAQGFDTKQSKPGGNGSKPAATQLDPPESIPELIKLGYLDAAQYPEFANQS